MIKAVITPLCLALLLGQAFCMSAQTAPTGNSAIEEGVRRQAAQIALRQKLVDARAAELRRDWSGASKLYGEAWRLVETIGSGVDVEARQTVEGLTAVRMELARQAQNRHDYRDARVHVNEVLRVNPTNPDAIAFRATNDRLLAEQEGRIASPEVQSQAAVIQQDKVTASTHVQNARFFFEAGKFDEAEAELNVALKINPTSESALYYQSLVQQARFKQTSDRRSVDAGRKMVEVQEAWNDSVKRYSLQVPNPIALTNLINTSANRQGIMSKLDRIRLDTVSYDALPLSEVIRNLSDEVKRRDPSKRGINFLINPNPETVSMTPVTTVVGGGFPGGAAFTPPPPVVPTIDPTTGLPIAPAAPVEEAVDINAVAIKINPPLSDVRLADVLEAIVTVADHPIKYSLTDYAVIFSLKGPETPQLHMRTFKVDPNTFIQGLESVGGLDFESFVSQGGQGGGGGGRGGGGGGGGGRGGGGQSGESGGAMTIPRVVVSGGTLGGQGGGQGGQGGGQSGSGLTGVTRTNLTAAYSQAVITYFAAVGVDLSPQSGKNVFFNDREGTLLVRATSQELDIIEAAVQTLNIAPPQVNVKTKFVEVTQNDTKALGFDWYLGNFLMGGGAMGMQGGTAPSYSDGSGGVFPGSIPGGTAIPEAASDSLLTSGLRNTVNAPSVATFTGILTDPQFRVVLRALEQRDGADLLNQGEVTTLSGRQAQIQVVDLRYIVTESSVDTGGGGGGAVGGAVGTTVSTPISQQIVPLATPIPLGPTLDVIPYVSADGYTIQMTLIPTIVEFIGYDDPGPFLIQAQAVGGAGGASVPLTSVLPLPHFRVRQITSSVIVWDGQTIVLGGLISDNITRVKDKIPVLGDLPLLGRFFRNESSQTQKKNLVIFVTPTIIDPAGNRLHTDEELPFAQSAIPVQRAEP
jgi:general secretion pathway protein D